MKATASSRGPIGLLLLLVFAQVLAMALWSPPDAHPDESLHVTTASYFLDHWLPPAADDPMVPSYLNPEYGTSYLLASPPQMLYPLAAKTTGVLGFSSHFSLGLRLLSVAAWLALAVAAWRVSPRSRLPAVCLLWTPQVWYVFGYFNSDAFPFFLAFLVCLQAGLSGSAFRRFLDAPAGEARWRSAVPVSLLLGLMLLAKHNYLPFIVFVALFLVWRVSQRPSDERRLYLGRAAAVCVLAVAIAAPVLIRDTVINRFEKEERKAALREQYAADAFKPSRIGAPDSNPGLALRAKGVPFPDLFTRRHWTRRITRSFGGVYGPMTILAPPAYYIIQALLYAGLAVLAAAALRREWTRPRVILLCLAILASAAVILMAALFCWVFDFQPQGRYLFPLLPIFLLTGLELSGDRPTRIPWAVPAALFLLGTASFLLVGFRGVLP
ncbi:MAG: DUF2142 domain-containing protein [Verrucomicrobia bacterium]|nr:DUF2142 domain-containing protein [Verrucomicrobiota bacterium]